MRTGESCQLLKHTHTYVLQGHLGLLPSLSHVARHSGLSSDADPLCCLLAQTQAVGSREAVVAAQPLLLGHSAAPAGGADTGDRTAGRPHQAARPISAGVPV